MEGIQGNQGNEGMWGVYNNSIFVWFSSIMIDDI